MASQSSIAEQGTLVLSDQLRHDQKPYHAPSYVFSPQFPANQSITIPITNSLGQTQITVPPNAYNCAASYLEYVVNLPAPTAGNYTWTFNDTNSEIDHILFYPASKQMVVDLENQQNYSKIQIKRKTSLNEYLTFDKLNVVKLSNSLNTSVPALRHSVAAPVAPPNPSSLNYIEPAYFSVGQQSVAANPGPARVSYLVQLPLRLIKDCFFEVDKTIYFPENMFLKLYTSMLSKICYMSTSNANPSSGTPTPFVALATEAAAGFTANISNIQLMLAIETNPINVQRAMAESAAGFMMLIPHPKAYKNPGKGASQVIAIPIEVGSGHQLMKSIHAVFHADGNNPEALDQAYDCQNNYDSTANGISPVAGMTQKIIEYWTSINGVRQQTNTLACTAVIGTDMSTDYLQLKSQLAGSVLENYNVFQYNFHHCDDYSNFGPKYEQNHGQNFKLIGGLPMDSIAKTWTFNGNRMTNGVQYQHYTWLIFTKRLMIAGGQVTIS